MVESKKNYKFDLGVRRVNWKLLRKKTKSFNFAL